MSKFTITVTDNYLVLPIGRQVDMRKLKLTHNGNTVKDLDLRLDYVNPSEYVYCDARAYRGQQLTIETVPDVEYQDIQTDEPEIRYGDLKSFRPRIHFTPDFGWINDPNGLLEYVSPVTGEKTYHMFYQYNPYDTIWGNMHWGHATSTDLLHWQHQPIALFPDELGTMFSGSAIIDRENRTGLKDGDEDVILLFYTAAGGANLLSEGKRFTQCLAYSTDGGKTFRKYENNPIIPNIKGDNRDPKVIWCAEMDRYIMALYLEESSFAILVSDDLLHWELLQEIVIEGEAECPDIYPLNANNDSKQRKWIISGASHRYIICEHKNNRFNIIQNARSLHYGRFSYASQTFSDVSDGRRINLAWNRDLHFPGAPFNGQMSIPMKMSLKEKNSEYFLCAEPIKELMNLTTGRSEYTNLELDHHRPFSLPLEKSAYLIEMDLSHVSNSRIIVNLFGKNIKIEPAMNLLRVGENTVPLSVSGIPGRLRILVDTCSIELFTGDGEAMMTSQLLCDYNLNVMHLHVDGHTTLRTLTVTELVP